MACADNTPPEFLSVTQLADSQSAIGPYEVAATVIDDVLVARVSLSYAVPGFAEDIPMTRVSGNAWIGAIPGQDAGTTVEYRVVAYDEDKGVAPFPVKDNGEAATWRFTIASD